MYVTRASRVNALFRYINIGNHWTIINFEESRFIEGKVNALSVVTFNFRNDSKNEELLIK